MQRIFYLPMASDSMADFSHAQEKMILDLNRAEDYDKPNPL